MSRVALAKIKSLTFYKDSLTKSRRSDPIAQLNCIGKACSLYEPDAVRCVNIGGTGTEVDWKCEADLPEALRFGRVEVSCEGWDGPGDPYVLKGSCGLNYRLVEVPSVLRGNGRETHRLPSQLYRWFGNQDISATIFMIVWIGALLFILYTFLKTCFDGRPRTVAAGRPRRPGPGPGSGWFPRTYRNDRPSGTDAPPPYTKYPSATSSGAQEPGWRPGFWTGAALGGLGTYLLNSRQDTSRTAHDPRYDWERQRQGSFFRPAASSSGYVPQHRSAFSNSDDRGEGSSNLGPMRRSTGIGGSSVR